MKIKSGTLIRFLVILGIFLSLTSGITKEAQAAGTCTWVEQRRIGITPTTGADVLTAVVLLPIPTTHTTWSSLPANQLIQS